MKKIYSIIAAVAVGTVGASAMTAINKINAEIKVVREKTALTVSNELPAQKAPAKAPVAGWEAAGTGVFSDGLLGSAFESVLDYGATWEVAIEKNGSWYRLIPYGEGTPVAELMGEADASYLYINAENPDKVYFEDFTAYESFTFVNLVPESAVGAALIENNPTLEATYGKLVDGSFIFPMKNNLMADTETDGSYLYNDYDGLTALALPGNNIRTSWSVLGTTNFTEGIVSSMYMEDRPQQYEVTVTENYFTKGYYRIPNAWAPYFESGTSAALTLDLTDSGYGVSATTYVMEDSQDGATYIVSQSYAYANMTKVPVYRNDFVANYPQYNITLDENRTVNMPANSFFFMWPEADPDGGTNPNSLYTAQNAAASIFIIPEKAGINDAVIDDNEDAPVEYFNLQGIRVANPENGLYIRRQGSKTTKVLVK